MFNHIFFTYVRSTIFLNIFTAMAHFRIDIEERKEHLMKPKSLSFSSDISDFHDFHDDSTAIWARDLFQLKERESNEIIKKGSRIGIGHLSVILLFTLGIFCCSDIIFLFS